MSDYLSNLIDRSFNRTEMIKPLLPSRFEPLQQSKEMEIDRFSELDGENFVLQPSQVNLSLPPQSKATNQLFPSSKTNSLLSLPTPSEQKLSEESITPLSRSAQKLTDESVEQYVVDQVEETIESNETEAPHQSESPLLPLQERKPHPMQPTIRPQITSFSESIVSSVPAVKAEPQTINITIGRVDVRAIAPTSSPRQTPKSPTPNLSLAEYLKSGGRS